jgi:hypothetical protein
LTRHQTPEKERQVREAALDETIEASFPASDPPSSVPNPYDDDALERNRRPRPRGSPLQGGVSRGDPFPSNCVVIEIHVAELRQLFNAIDPSPFREKDLDPNAEEFIVGWAREVPRDARLALLVHLDRRAGIADEPAILRAAIREFFGQRAEASRRKLRQLFRVGRTSLLIGVGFLAGSLLLGDLIASVLRERRIGELLRESLVIGGWVAMWRPLEVFLYDWWPIRSEARLADRLSAMPVRIAYTGAASSEVSDDANQ